MSTSFQPAEWDSAFFQQNPGATMSLWKLASQHIRIQPVSQGVPQLSPDQWDFSQLDAVVIPLLGVADHSPEFQVAVAPSFMNDAQGHLMRSHYRDFATFAANLVRYYNKGGFDAGGKHYQSPSPYHITFWGIFNEPNINGLSADDYVDLYNLVVPAMQAIDPDIKFVAVELSDFGDEPQNMMPTFVQRVTAHVDIVATHYYGSCNQSDPDQAVFDAISSFTDHVTYIYSQLRTNPALANVPVWITENNVNADYDQGNGISACNGTSFTTDQRGTSAYFAAWRPLVFSKLAQVGAQSLYHWDHDADAQYGEVDYSTDNLYLSYWVNYYLAHFFPSPPGADILRTNNTNSGALEALAVRNDDGSAVVMLVNHRVRLSTDNNGPGVSRTVALDTSALGAFTSVTQVTIDATTDPTQGPTPVSLTFAPQMQISLNGYSASFLRFNVAKPQFSADGVKNAASYQSGAVSPGEIVSFFGTAFGPAAAAGGQISSPGFLDNALAGTKIYFDGISAPLVYASSTQVNAIVPFEVAGRSSTQVQVEYLGALSDPVSVPVAPAIPGLFTSDFSGTGQGAIVNQDGTINSAANPAERGSIVSLYATGAGQTKPTGVDGEIGGSILPKTALPVSVTIGNVGVPAGYAGGGQTLVAGGVQINVAVPESVTPGDAVPVVITVGTAGSQAGVTIAVK
ncbi:MAG TPA: hypothetical protein VMT32_08920 [Bryobacteraceae bacterium]|nr:hypothetical protein [Bryobacteraceae bacterium]